MWQEYKAFLLRSNLLELAVAFVLGIAFAALVTAFTEGLVTTPIAEIFGEPDFGELRVGPFVIGPFLNALVSFILLATVLFFVVKGVSRIRLPPDASSPTPDTDEIILLREIRDLLEMQRR